MGGRQGGKEAGEQGGKLDLQCTNFWISGPAGGTLKGAAGENVLDFVGLNVNCTGKQGNNYFQ